MPTVEDRLTSTLDVVAADAAAVDEEGRFPERSIDALRRSGLLGLTLPAEAGGLGAGPVEFADVTTRLAAACGSTAMVYLMHVAAAMPVAAAPPPGLPDAVGHLASGSWLGTLAFSEKGSRSHFWAPLSRAIPDGNGRVHVKAVKGWVTSAGLADLYVVSCLAPDDQHPTDTNLYALATDGHDLVVAAPWDGLGLRGNASAPMEIDTDVDERQRLGARGEGFRLMMEVVLPWFNLGNAAVSVGLARAGLDAAVAHCTGARFEHLDSTLADLPTIRARLARAAIELDATAAYVRETAARMAAGDDTVMLSVLGVKAAANDTALRVTDEAMRVCGGAAFSKHLAVERAFRDARAGHVMAPTADALYEFYGRALCGLDLF
ncbi:MAG: acyl-CoA dehydrogenase family protein [Acidimicrobiales bacterium]